MQAACQTTRTCSESFLSFSVPCAVLAECCRTAAKERHAGSCRLSQLLIIGANSKIGCNAVGSKAAWHVVRRYTSETTGRACLVGWEGLVGSALKASRSFHFDTRLHPNTQLLLLLLQQKKLKCNLRPGYSLQSHSAHRRIAQEPA